MTPELRRLAPLQALDELRCLAERLDRAEARQLRAERRARAASGLAALSLGATLLLNVRPSALAQTPGVSLAALVSHMAVVDRQITALGAGVATLQSNSPFTVSGNDVTLSGYNLHVVNGAGSTRARNGLGNLIVGYDEMRPDGVNDRIGSHNIVTGQFNNYRGDGGIVGGSFNDLGGYEASITGGSSNETPLGANQPCVTGGGHNQATGDYAAVTGGSGNVASGQYAAITGGDDGRAPGDYAAVTGGFGNVASGNHSSVSGGFTDAASGQYASAAGGFTASAPGDYAAAVGGFGNVASGQYAAAVGGSQNAASGQYASVSGGGGVTASAPYVWAAGSYHSP